MRLGAAVVLAALLLAGSGFAQIPPVADRREPRLNGIIVTPDQRSAIFDSDGVPSTVAEGMSVGPWTIVGITAHAVEVAGPGGTAFIVPDARATGPGQTDFVQPATGDAMFALRTR